MDMHREHNDVIRVEDNLSFDQEFIATEDVYYHNMLFHSPLPKYNDTDKKEFEVENCYLHNQDINQENISSEYNITNDLLYKPTTSEDYVMENFEPENDDVRMIQTKDTTDCNFDCRLATKTVDFRRGMAADCDMGSCMTVHKNHLNDVRVYTAKKPYSCNACNKTFSMKNNLTLHMSVHSTKQCLGEVCNESFKTKSSVSNNMSTVSNKSTCLCHESNKPFDDNANGTEHQNTHTATKSYSCDKVLRHNSNLTDKTASVQPLPRDVAIDGIKLECDDSDKEGKTNQEPLTNNDMFSGLTITEDFVIDDIKFENDDALTLGRINTEDKIDYQSECGLITTEDFVPDNIKIKIKQEIITAEDFTNINMICRSSLPADVGFNSIKVETCAGMKKDGVNESATNADVKREDIFMGLDHQDINQENISSDHNITNDLLYKSTTSKDYVMENIEAENDDVSMIQTKNTTDCNFDCRLATNTVDFRREMAAGCDMGSCMTVRKDHLHDVGVYAAKKLFSCYICNKTFRMKNKLTLHMSVHSTKQCLDEVCNESFKIKSSVSNNTSKVSSKNTYLCDESNKPFDEKANGTEHQNTHTATKSYSCDKVLRHNSNLTEVTVFVQPLPRDVAIDGIKLECDDSHKQGKSNPECVTNNDMFGGSITTEDFVTDNIKVKIKQEIITAEDFTNINMICRSSLPTDVDFNSVKVETCAGMKKDGVNESATNADVKREDIFMGLDHQDINQEDISSDHNITNDFLYKSTTSEDYVMENIEAENDDVSMIQNKDTTDCNCDCRLATKTVDFRRGMAAGCDMGSCMTVHKNHLHDVRVYTAKKLYSCNICSKTFRMKNNLTLHMSVHSTKQYLDEVCNESFKTKSSVSNHMSTVSSKNVYSCHEKNKPFNDKANGTEHLNTHTATKSYSCDKVFRPNSNLTEKTVSLQPLPQDVHGIKFEFDDSDKQGKTNQEHLTNNDMLGGSTTNEDFVIDNIKFENDDFVTLGRINTEDKIDYDSECETITTEDFVTDNIKVKIKQEIITAEDFTNINMICRSSLPTDVGFNSIKVETCARMKKDGVNESTTNADVKREDIFMVSVMSEDITQRNAQNCKKYYYRKKLLAQQLQSKNEVIHTPSTSSLQMTFEPQPITTVSEMSEDITKRNAQYCKKYYSRKKSANQGVVKKKTNSEKCRQYRQRKKLLAQQLQSKNEVIHIPSTSSLQMTFEPQLITTGEDYSSDDNIPRAEEKAKLSAAAEQHVTKITNDSSQVNGRRTAADGRLTVDKLSCDICPYQTNSEPQLLSHLKAHDTVHKDRLQDQINLNSSKKTYSCDVCTKKFSYKNNLTVHLRTHSGEKPFSCEVCHKTFSRKIYLSSHMRTHSGEKPFSCEVCHKTFSHKSNLTVHLRTHSGERPFSCEVCHKTFSQKNNLTVHLRRHSRWRPRAARPHVFSDGRNVDD